ncbi:MAG: cytochrome d ubiquinol oxidase subunit II [Planctomycetota bacterium]
MDLNTIWFLLVGVLFIGYAILDGFDLGVGVLSLFGKSPEEKRIHLNAIGPVWDGNEVWLLTGGGALFAAFPPVYATVFSGFYMALMLLLFALIARAVSMEFRSKVDSPGWQKFWDAAFGIGSLLPAVLFGVAFGNILRGVPITEDHMWAGSFFGLLNPYSILIGVVTLVLMVTHGAAYMVLKTDGELRDRMKAWSMRGFYAFVALYILATIATALVSPWLFEGVLTNPIFWLLVVLMVGAVAAFPTMTKKDRPFAAFLATSTMMLSGIGFAALSLFPRLVPSSLDLDWSLTAYNASSTDRTLTVMLIIALVGMPFVIGYTAVIYRVFKGKVILDDTSY